MSLIDAALSRSRTTLVGLLFLLVAGTSAWITIPKESEPDINIPIVYVSLHHEGISPQDAERLLVRPMEQEMATVEGVKEMRSTAYLGGANVLLEFEAGQDIDQAMIDVREAVDTAKADLPDDTDEPTVNEVNLSKFPILAITLSGDIPERALVRIARDLQDRLETIPTVLEANIRGDREEVVEVIVDPVRIEAYALNLQDILTLLARSNQLVAAGSLDTGAGRFAVKIPGLFESVNDILDMPLITSGDSVIKVRDIATVRRTFKDRELLARVGGQPAVVVEVSKRTGENIIETIEQVRAVVADSQSAWPADLEVSFAQDGSVFIKRILSDLQNNVIAAVLLVMIVILGALGVRAGSLVGLSIPGAFLTGILALQLFGLTVNMVVLFSLILSVGLLVDGAIVVTEYAERKLAEGASPHDAYATAAKRMAWPIIASTATTLAAFAPLLFWPGIVGEFMKFMPITLVVTLVASLAMALIFVPVLGVNLGFFAHLLVLALSAALGATLTGWLAGGVVGLVVPGFAGGLLLAIPGALAGGWIGHKLGRRAARAIMQPPAMGEGRVVRDLESDTDLDIMKLGGLAGLYVHILNRALRRPGLIIAGAFSLLVVAGMLYGQLGRGVEFFPDAEPDQANLSIHARGNLSVEEKAHLVREVEAHVLAVQRDHNDFKTIYTVAGNIQSQDNDAEDVIGRITLEFRDWQVRRRAADIMADILDRTSGLAGIFIETTQAEAGPPVGKPVQVQLASNDAVALDAAAGRVRAYIDSLTGLKDIEDTRPLPGIEWEITVDRAQAAKFGADVQMIGSFVQLVTKGLKISTYRPDDTDEEIDISVRFPDDDRTLARLDSIRLQTSEGAVPMSNFVQRTPVQRTGTLFRSDGTRVITIKADVQPGVLADDKVRQIRSWLAGASLNPAVEVTFKGEDEEQKAAQAFLQRAFVIALFVMAIILLAQFNGFYSVILILSAVVMSTTGVFLGLLILGQPFGIVMSGIGVIALAGIVVNNNIVLIDTYDRVRKTFPDVREAIIRTGAQRLRPVLLTTITTIIGLAPMVFQLNIDFVTRE
ncbi:MAG: efflux RND transporter permease subunit, partial [Alphaproteobacteria bacterium]